MNLIQYVGMDVHNDSGAISLAPSDSTEVRRWGLIGGTHEHVPLDQTTPGGPSRGDPEACLAAQFCDAIARTGHGHQNG